MARLTFPSDRLVYTASTYAGSAFTSTAGAVATVYSDSAGTTLADVQNFDGSANATATFTVDTTSRLPQFLGPAAGTDTLYVKVGTGPVTAIYAVTAGDISAAIGTEVANRQAADALLAKPRGAWVTATAYAVNDVVTSGGAPYRCLTAHTSGTFATDLAAGKWEAWGSAASGAPLPDRWMSRYAGAIDWATDGATIPWTAVDHSAGSAFGEWSVDGTTFTFTEDVRARVVVQIGVSTNAAASGVIGLGYTASAGTATSAPAWTQQVDEGLVFLTVAPSTSGHLIYENVEIYPELLWKAGNTITVRSRTLLDAGAIFADEGTDITIFAAGADPNP